MLALPQLLAALADAQPDQVDIARKALSEAISAGHMGLALRLARTVPAAKLPIERGCCWPPRKSVGGIPSAPPNGSLRRATLATSPSSCPDQRLDVGRTRRSGAGAWRIRSGSPRSLLAPVER